jgi:ribosomal protein L16/L10AE
MYQPTARHFRKINRQHLCSTYENKSCRLRFGFYGIQALENGYLAAYQIEAIRRTLSGCLKRKGKL